MYPLYVVIWCVENSRDANIAELTDYNIDMQADLMAARNLMKHYHLDVKDVNSIDVAKMRLRIYQAQQQKGLASNICLKNGPAGFYKIIIWCCIAI